MGDIVIMETGDTVVVHAEQGNGGYGDNGGGGYSGGGAGSHSGGKNGADGQGDNGGKGNGFDISTISLNYYVLTPGDGGEPGQGYRNRYNCINIPSDSCNF